LSEPGAVDCRAVVWTHMMTSRYIAVMVRKQEISEISSTGTDGMHGVVFHVRNAVIFVPCLRRRRATTVLKYLRTWTKCAFCGEVLALRYVLRSYQG